MKKMNKKILSASLALGLVASSVSSLTAFAAPKFSPYDLLQAELTAGKSGVEVQTEGDVKYIAGLEKGDYFASVPLNFTSGVAAISANIRTTAPGWFEARLDKADGEIISTFRVSSTNGEFKSVSAPAKAIEGNHTIYFVGKVGNIDIDSWKANLAPGQQPVTPEPTPEEPTPVEPTPVATTVNPYETVEGENSAELKAAVVTTVDNTKCAMIRSNGYAAAKNVDFSKGLAAFTVAAKASKLGVLEIRLDNPESKAIANVKLNAGAFSTKTVKVASGIEGTHDVYFVSTATGATVYLDSWSVMAPPTKPEPTPEDPTPVDPTPVDPTPVDPTPVDPTPVDPTPVDPTPVDPTPVDPTPAESGLALDYQINSWGTGYTINFKIVNNSKSTVNGWTLKIKKSDINVSSGWCAKIAEEGEYYVFTPESWNGTLPAGGSADLGIVGSGQIGNSLNFILQ